LEKGACNITVVRGTLSQERAQSMVARGRGRGNAATPLSAPTTSSTSTTSTSTSASASIIDTKGGQPYAAAAMSLVFHTRSPLLPTLRADVRVFEVDGTKWYGGGCDLTPAYLNIDDAGEFHTYWKKICEEHG
jgi:coproporphyrinogen III oxidase